MLVFKVFVQYDGNGRDVYNLRGGRQENQNHTPFWPDTLASLDRNESFYCAGVTSWPRQFFPKHLAKVELRDKTNSDRHTHLKGRH